MLSLKIKIDGDGRNTRLPSNVRETFFRPDDDDFSIDGLSIFDRFARLLSSVVVSNRDTRKDSLILVARGENTSVK